jgi:hypothetical protein
MSIQMLASYSDSICRRGKKLGVTGAPSKRLKRGRTIRKYTCTGVCDFSESNLHKALKLGYRLLCGLDLG